MFPPKIEKKLLEYANYISICIFFFKSRMSKILPNKHTYIHFNKMSLLSFGKNVGITKNNIIRTTNDFI